jgi:hypothetical protein
MLHYHHYRNLAGDTTIAKDKLPGFGISAQLGFEVMEERPDAVHHQVRLGDIEQNFVRCATLARLLYGMPPLPSGWRCGGDAFASGRIEPAGFAAVDLAGGPLFKNLDQTPKAKRSLKKRDSRQDAPDRAFFNLLFGSINIQRAQQWKFSQTIFANQKMHSHPTRFVFFRLGALGPIRISLR